MRLGFSIVLFLIGWAVLAQQTKKVFFVGNSYTSSIPPIIQQIATAAGDELTFSAHTPGASTFQQHASNSNVISTIEQGDWDYVVLQEQSQIPAFPEGQFNAISRPYAAQLSQMVKANNECALVMFYMTWGRKNGDQQNCPGWPPVCTYEGMDDLLYERYMLMAEENEDVASPVGAVWRYIRENHPEIELYSGDGSHPSTVGAVASAYTFYTSLFKNSPYDSNYQGNLDETTINIVKGAVQTVVFDNMDSWFLLDYLPQADFDYSMTDFEVEFTNHSENADSYFWDFGDGATSTEENPSHIYEESGIYTVQLTVEKCGESDTIEQEVEVASLAVSDLNHERIKIYPNPASDYLYLDIQEIPLKVNIFDGAGNRTSSSVELTSNGLKIDLRSLNSGLYVLKLETKTGIKTFKFIKKKN